MAKRVHFAARDIFHSPTPSPGPSSNGLKTPSPTPSDSSVPSTHELYQEVEPKTMQIHRLLAYTPYNPPPIPFDLAQLPSVSPHLLPPGTALSDPATHPPMGCVTITILVPVSNIPPWEVTVSAPQGQSFITVIEVLRTLYRALRLAVHPFEYNSLAPEEAALVNAAYFQRCSLIEGPGRAKEEQKGVKKIDLFMGRTRFMGLCVSGERTDVWELTLS
ncbi:hypothetical protein BDQ17DRAFT_1249574 [Cyathus striatus]|nr:hypothetical protein BDQ17DRAFT_1249574 [Cyathus striatus]